MFRVLKGVRCVVMNACWSDKHAAQIAKLFDHVSESYVWAHDLVTLHYSDDDTDYPLLVVHQNIVENLMVEPSRHRRKHVNKRTIKTS